MPMKGILSSTGNSIVSDRLGCRPFRVVRNIVAALVFGILARVSLRHQNNGFQELKRLVDFVNEKYDDILAQLKQANEKTQRQGTSLKQMRKDLDDATKQAQDAMNGFENLAEYLRRDCIEISSVPPSESQRYMQSAYNGGRAGYRRTSEGGRYIDLSPTANF